MRNSLIYLLIVVAVITVFFLFFDSGPLDGAPEIPISEVVAIAEDPGNDTVRIEVDGDDLTIRKGASTFVSRKEPGASIVELLDQVGARDNVVIEVKESGSGLGNVIGLLINFLPLILFGGILLFMMRQAQGSSNQAMGFGRSRARMFVGTKATVTFFDVAGAPEAKQELEEVVEFLKYPERFVALGARIPRGVLLVGPPGTGKTLLAKAVAGEAGVPFFSISGSEFVEMFVGVGASRVRDLFEQAKRHGPAIIFVDEIDAVGRHRGAGLGGGHDEREQTLNQILVEMDGFETGTNVIVIAATNRPDILDPALLRPGRFDRRVTLDSPDIRGRTAILDVHAKGKPLAEDVDLQNLAQQTPGFSGADLANLINEAAILAARRNKKEVGQDEMLEAIDRLIAGPARKSRVISKHEKEVTAFHESGHAIVGYFMPHADKVHKISIVARGRMGGYTRYLPDEERTLQTKNQFEAMIATAMGGRVAEQMVFDEVTTGASNDIEKATQIARAMVTQFGMSEKLGPRLFGKREEMVFLGKDLGEHRDYGPRTEELIDEEVDRLLQAGWEHAERIITEQRTHLDDISRFLIEHETIDGKQMVDIVEGRDPLAVAEVEEPVEEVGVEEPESPSASSDDPGRAPDIRDANPQPGLD
ncbi:MAG: ATP-dependent zinc metalloprotease FtsH [Chloroflexi bacterium]|nr:ATP-dependent zinc metalloprotease FtsH [Chloroflexota bacterium]MBT4074080.1 ATP-dependent zinc metalloprotease FtsH [Chloroflexota bacterium]MBT4514283.1 ATP-dependent zinc metalloprotease FtsH [Chloroflexota bacterium]MBT6681881.1 ATP-dependent zinc metalloprotease FtsH [Chloroflexota bacterium]